MDFWFIFFVASVNLPWQMAALHNRQSSCCERLSISAAAEKSALEICSLLLLLLLLFNNNNSNNNECIVRAPFHVKHAQLR